MFKLRQEFYLTFDDLTAFFGRGLGLPEHYVGGGYMGVVRRGGSDVLWDRSSPLNE